MISCYRMLEAGRLLMNMEYKFHPSVLNGKTMLIGKGINMIHVIENTIKIVNPNGETSLMISKSISYC